jgi:hypothetical protein
MSACLRIGHTIENIGVVVGGRHADAVRDESTARAVAVAAAATAADN